MFANTRTQKIILFLWVLALAVAALGAVWQAEASPQVCGPNLGCYMPASQWYSSDSPGEGYIWDVSPIRDCWTNAHYCDSRWWMNHKITYCVADEGVRFGPLSEYDLLKWSPPSDAVRVMIWDECPPATGSTEPAHVPAKPYATAWSIDAPEGTAVDWYYDGNYVGTSYSEVTPRGDDPAHPFVRLILADYQTEEVLDHLTIKINGQERSFTWIDFTNTDNVITKVVQREH